MHITTRSLLALKTLLACAAEPERLFRKHEIAAQLGASENHLAQVIHQLARKGFLATQRGRAGGLRLARAADKITLGDVLRRFESDLPLLSLTCEDRLGAAFAQAEEAFYAKFDALTLTDMLVRPRTLTLAAE
jgi:Rrf2 family nitric oxide-sensitive transcriptional repressor